MDMQITFPGGKRVDAQYKGFDIKTDQPVRNGGDGSEPAPFDLFLASLGTCAGIFVLSFCQERKIPTDNIRIIMRTEKSPEKTMIEKITIEIILPKEFPERYLGAVRQSANLCSVKKHMQQSPDFEITTTYSTDGSKK
jgi:putative redox protein